MSGFLGVEGMILLMRAGPCSQLESAVCVDGLERLGVCNRQQVQYLDESANVAGCNVVVDLQDDSDRSFSA